MKGCNCAVTDDQRELRPKTMLSSSTIFPAFASLKIIIDACMTAAKQISLSIANCVDIGNEQKL